MNPRGGRPFFILRSGPTDPRIYFFYKTMIRISHFYSSNAFAPLALPLIYLLKMCTCSFPLKFNGGRSLRQSCFVAERWPSRTHCLAYHAALNTWAGGPFIDTNMISKKLGFIIRKDM